MSTSVAPALEHPVQLDIEYARKHSRILLLLRWLLVVPHLIVLLALTLLSLMLTVVAAIAVLITRHYPGAIFNFNAGVARYGWCISAYLYLLTDRFPPFALGNRERYPVHYRIEYPHSVARWRVLFAWLVALPVLVLVVILNYALALIMVLAFLIILVTGRYPRGMFGLSARILGLSARTNAYVAFMTTRYPL